MNYAIGLIVGIGLFGNVFAETLPDPTGFVNDYTNTLSNQTRIDLESSLNNYEKETGREISIAIVQSLEGTTVEDYAVRLFEKWQIGKKDQDNGLLFLIAKDDRKIRIEVGYGLEGVMTDLQTKRILDGLVTPAFRLGDFEGGIFGGVDAIIATLNNEPLPETITSNVRKTIWDSDLAGFLIWFSFIISSYFFSIAARSKSWHAGGIWGISVGTIVGILAASVLAWLALSVVLGSFGLLFDYAVSKAYRKAKKNGNSPPWWAGGRSSFWGGFDSNSRGGGFGGFGGGLSGGGGSSGGW